MMKQNRSAVAFVFSLSLVVGFLGSAHAADWSAMGSWVDTTQATDDYTANYHAQCRIDGVQMYEDSTLPTPGFTTTLIFDAPQIADCRWRNENVFYDPPIVSQWSPWLVGTTATTPDVPSGGTLIFIYQAP